MSTEFKYGLLSGVGISSWLAAEHALGLHAAHLEIGEFTRYFPFLILLLALFFLLGKKQSERPRDLGSSVVSGLTASFLGALLVYGFNLVYNQWINPEWIDNTLAIKVTAMRARDIGEVEIRRAITAFRQANSAAGLVTRVIVSLTVIGGIFSALLALVMQQRTPPQSVR